MSLCASVGPNSHGSTWRKRPHSVVVRTGEQHRHQAGGAGSRVGFCDQARRFTRLLVFVEVLLCRELSSCSVGSPALTSGSEASSSKEEPSGWRPVGSAEAWGHLDPSCISENVNWFPEALLHSPGVWLLWQIGRLALQASHGPAWRQAATTSVPTALLALSRPAVLLLTFSIWSLKAFEFAPVEALPETSVGVGSGQRSLFQPCCPSRDPLPESTRLPLTKGVNTRARCPTPNAPCTA